MHYYILCPPRSLVNYSKIYMVLLPTSTSYLHAQYTHATLLVQVPSTDDATLLAPSRDESVHPRD
jgi:hypothetical protein